MAYDPEFYRLYSEYLEEPVVRRRHRHAWNALAPSDWRRCVELGASGHVVPESIRMENDRWQRLSAVQWVGIDVNAVWEENFICGDYRRSSILDTGMLRLQPDFVVSLFSSEITAPAEENLDLYKRIFSRPSVESMLVSGFYYVGKKDVNPVVEAGGVTSFQTLFAPEEFRVPGTYETRLTVPVPSQLFGPDVYEVWRLLRREE